MMENSANLERFMEFYQVSSGRIGERIRSFNQEIEQEELPLIAPFAKWLSDLNEGGKLLRGVFVNLGYLLSLTADRNEGIFARDIDPTKSDGLSLAFEMFQTAVLVHDDIIDHASLRRGKETIHKRYEDSIRDRSICSITQDTPSSAAICTGDLGLFYANRIIAREYNGNEHLGELIDYFNQVVIDTIRGELLDVILPCEIRDQNRTPEENERLLQDSVFKIYELKTAYYSVVGPLHLGMLLGGAGEELMGLVDVYAMKLGIAFQIKDDILGIYGTEAGIGKSTSADIEEAKLTILYQYVKANAPEAHKRLMEHYGKPDVKAEDILAVQGIFRETGALAYAEQELLRCYDEAKAVLNGTTFLSELNQAVLLGIGEYFINRKK